MNSKEERKTFNTQIPAELANEFQREYDSIRFNSRNIALLIAKDVRIDNELNQTYLSDLINSTRAYSKLKNKVSDEYAIPEANSRWGNVSIDWVLRFKTATLEITEKGPADEIISNAFTVDDDELVSTLENLEVMKEVYDGIIEYAAKHVDNFKTPAYFELEKMRKETFIKNENLKSDISDEIVIPLLDKLGIVGTVEWRLNFSSKTGSIIMKKG